MLLDCFFSYQSLQCTSDKDRRVPLNVIAGVIEAASERLDWFEGGETQTQRILQEEVP